LYVAGEVYDNQAKEEKAEQKGLEVETSKERIFGARG
jgi:hypothetical protein